MRMLRRFSACSKGTRWISRRGTTWSMGAAAPPRPVYPHVCPARTFGAVARTVLTPYKTYLADDQVSSEISLLEPPLPAKPSGQPTRHFPKCTATLIAMAKSEQTCDKAPSRKLTPTQQQPHNNLLTCASSGHACTMAACSCIKHVQTSMCNSNHAVHTCCSGDKCFIIESRGPSHSVPRCGPHGLANANPCEQSTRPGPHLSQHICNGRSGEALADEPTPGWPRAEGY